MELFLWPPDWGAKVVERLEWLTDVQQSSNGTEVRRSLRTSPRTSISFEVIVEGVEAQRLKNFIRKNQGKPVMIPWWLGGFKKWQVSPSFGRWAIYSESGLRPQDLGFSDYRVAPMQAIFFHADTDEHEIHAVTSVNSSNVTIAGGNTYPIGSMVYALVEAYLSSSQTLEHPCDTVCRMQVSFNLVEPLPSSGFSNVNPWKPVGDTTSIGTFMDQPDRTQDVTEEFQMLVQELDFGTGKRSFTDRSKQSFTLRSHEYIYEGRIEAFFFKNFLHDLKGRQGEFYVPTWQQDFKALRPDDPAVSFIGENVGNSNLDPTERPQHVIALGGIQADSNLAERVIQDVIIESWVPEEEYVETGAGTPDIGGDGLTPEKLRKVSWLERVRLNSDSVEIVWENSEVCTVQLPFRSIRRT